MEFIKIKGNDDIPDFEIGKYPVTNREYKKFVTHAEYVMPQYWEDERFNGEEYQPVVGVSWFDVKLYCDWLNSISKHYHRLPTESEWEWAASGGERKYPWGDDEPTPELANYGSKVGQTTPVGNYPAGATPDGLMDMAGNVLEWCEDWYDEQEKYRVLRGGSWFYPTYRLLCSYRDFYYPGWRYGNVGFRVVLVPSH